jgi:hypothetical protein
VGKEQGGFVATHEYATQRSRGLHAGYAQRPLVKNVVADALRV